MLTTTSSIDHQRLHIIMRCVLLLILTSSVAGDACTCKTKGSTVGTCALSVKDCGCLHDIVKWRYKADASETSSGKSTGYVEWSESSVRPSSA